MRTIDPAAPAGKPETDQMKVIHRAFRREFSLLSDQVARVADGDTTRARIVGDHLTLVIGMLHEHHEAEDELLWPVLHQRVPLKEDLIDTMETQHQTIAETVEKVARAQHSWRATGDAATRDVLAAELQDLEKVLGEHLTLEEDQVLPLIHEHLTVPEWLAPQKHAMAHGPSRVSDKLLLAGLVLEGATPQERAWFLHEMPPPARLLWRLMGARQYAAHQRAVRA